MPFSIRTRVISKPTLKLLQRAPRTSHKRFRRAFSLNGQDFYREMQLRFTAPLHVGPGKNPNTKLHSRRGAAGLRGSIGFRVEGNALGTLRLNLFSAGVKYARIQEFGGKITAKRGGGWLVFPVPPYNVNPGNGNARFPSARRFFEQFKDQVSWVPNPDAPQQKAVVMWDRSGAGDPVVMFVAVRSVVIPGPKAPGAARQKSRFGFIDTYERLRRTRFRERLRRALQLSLQDARQRSRRG